MSLLRSQLVAEVYQYCADPDDRPLKEGGLPQQLVFQVLCENEDELLRDLDLSTNNRRVGRTDVYLSQDDPEFTLSVSDMTAVSYAALLVDTTSNVWWPVDIVNHSGLPQAGIDERRAVAFRDTPPVGEVSWIPESSQTLRLWYDRNGNDAPQLLASTELGNLYDSYLKLRTAAQCRELIGMTVGGILESRLLSSQAQWKRSVDMSRMQGSGFKSPVFPRRRRTIPFIDPRRFFVP